MTAAELVSEFFTEHSDLSESVEENARKLAERVETKSTINRAPSSIAAASIYLTTSGNTGSPIYQTELSSAFDISEAPIRQTYSEILEKEIEGYGQAPTAGSGSNADWSDRAPVSLNLSKQLIDWADMNYHRFGFNSRSELVNHVLAKFRAEHTEDADE